MAAIHYIILFVYSLFLLVIFFWALSCKNQYKEHDYV